MRKLKTISALCLGIAVISGGVGVQFQIAQAKDIGPVHSNCDARDKGSQAWRTCVAKFATERQSDAELFYAGYWLAKSGQYREAMIYLRLAKNPDDRVLTYLGFAARKLGRTQEAFAYYQAALRKNPNAVVTRSYLGEAYLSIGALEKAKRELAEIATRCGKSCSPYDALADAVTRYERVQLGHG
ncbi:MAG: tetratricopeptide repeat protein [Hyphomicrobiaceae bacterium]